MPTAPPTQVIVHRIELQKTERQYLEKYIEDQQKIKLVSTGISAVVPLLQVGAVAGVAWLGIKLWGEIQALLNGPLEDIPAGMVDALAKLNPLQDPLVQIIKDKVGRHPKERLEDFDIDTPEGQEEYRQAVRDWEERKRKYLQVVRDSASMFNPFD
jgi:hypothetical protein